MTTRDRLRGALYSLAQIGVALAETTWVMVRETARNAFPCDHDIASISSDAHGMGQESTQKEIADWLDRLGYTSTAERVASGQWGHDYCEMLSRERESAGPPETPEETGVEKPYDCLFACMGRDQDGQHFTWRCLRGKHGHEGDHRFAFFEQAGEPFFDTPAARENQPRPAPSSTKCLHCLGPWREGHLCSAGMAPAHACSPNGPWSAEHGGWLCICGKRPASDWYAAWRKANP